MQFQSPRGYMTNIHKVQGILNSIAGQSNTQSDQLSFISSIISHLDFFFESILLTNHQKESQQPLPQRHDQSISIIKKPNEKNLPSQIENQDNADMNQQDELFDQDLEASEVPSVEEVSNFDDESSDKSYIKKKSIKKRKGKNKKNTPKKPVSSFVYYYKDRLQMIKKMKPQDKQTIGNLAKIVSKQWKQLDLKSKKPYLVKAEQSIRTYYSQKERISRQIKQKLVRPKKQAQKDVQRFNKGPLTSFFAYFKENAGRIAKQIGSQHRGKLAKVASQQWKLLPINEKSRYQKYSLENRLKMEAERSKKQEQKVLQAHISRRKRHKAKEEQQYMPSALRGRVSKTKTKRSNNEIYDQQDQEYYNMDIKEVDVLSQNKQKSTENEPKNEQCKSFKKQNEQSHSKNDGQDKNSDVADMIQQYTVIEVNSDDQLGNISSQNLEVMDDESFSLGQSKKVEKNEGNKIKGPNSAFLLYYQRVVKKLKMSNTGIHGSELVRLASTKWNQLPENEKMFYQNLAKKSRERYAQELNRANPHGKDNIRRKKCEGV